MTGPEPPTAAGQPLPADLVELESLLLQQSATWQPPADLRAKVLAQADAAAAQVVIERAAAIRQQRRWWNYCAAAVVSLAVLNLASLWTQKPVDHNDFYRIATPDTASFAQLPPADDAHPVPQWNAALRAQILSPALRLIPWGDTPLPAFPYQSVTPKSLEGGPS